MDNVERHLTWINTEILKYNSYHDHKETMAWLATAFYVTGAITLGVLLSNFQVCVRIFIAVGIAFAAYLFWFFVNMQFRNRWLASDFQLGLMKFAADLSCNSPTLTIPLRPEFTQDPKGRFPDHVWSYIRDSRPCFKEFWKREVWKGLCPCKQDEDRWKTEIPSYALIIVAATIAIVLLCVN